MYQYLLNLSFKIIVILFLAFGAQIIELFFLPALPSMAVALHSSQYLVQLSLSVLIFGTTVSYIFSGGLADCYGPKRVMQWLIGLYGVGVALCAFSFSIVMLLVGMFVIGMGAYYIILLMYIMKSYPGQALRVQALVNSFIFLVIIVVPFVSGYITHHYDWRYVFIGVLACCAINLCLTFFLPQTEPIRKSTINLKMVLAQFKHLFHYEEFNLLTLTLCATSSAPYVFYTLSPFFFIKDLHISTITYGVFLALLMFAQSVGSCVVSILTGRIQNKIIIVIGTTTFTLSVLMFIFLIHVTMNPFVLIIPVIASFMVLPLSKQTCRLGASLIVPKMMGAAVSLCSVLFNISNALTAISAAHIDGNEIGYGMLILSVIGLVSSLFIRSSHLGDDKHQ
jgi:MFS transporter, DHA1 family, multidrug resistance protein